MVCLIMFLDMFEVRFLFIVMCSCGLLLGLFLLLCVVMLILWMILVKILLCFVLDVFLWFLMEGFLFMSIFVFV